MNKNVLISDSITLKFLSRPKSVIIVSLWIRVQSIHPLCFLSSFKKSPPTPRALPSTLTFKETVQLTCRMSHVWIVWLLPHGVIGLVFLASCTLEVRSKSLIRCRLNIFGKDGHRLCCVFYWVVHDVSCLLVIIKEVTAVCLHCRNIFFTLYEEVI